MSELLQNASTKILVLTGVRNYKNGETVRYLTILTQEVRKLIKHSNIVLVTVAAL